MSSVFQVTEVPCIDAIVYLVVKVPVGSVRVLYAGTSVYVLKKKSNCNYITSQFQEMTHMNIQYYTC